MACGFIDVSNGHVCRCASMMPGGVGSTEAAIVFQLKWHGVDPSAAILVAVVIRLGTMWFSFFSDWQPSCIKK